jgi:geranyl-CoA carboxylase alpha subunit
MRLVASAGELDAALGAARREAAAAFGDARLVIERAVVAPRHVEFQVFGDAHGRVIHLGERDCSVQRRHQKLIEEAPCPALDPALRRAMGDGAVRLARAIGYVGAGTVEMLLQRDGSFFFMEMNTRLQVEHAVTEALAGIDLVEWQLRVAAGEALPLDEDEALARFESGGHAIEARLCAEDPLADDLPQGGRLAVWRAPEGLRCDHALEDDVAVPPFYDSMLAKLIAHAPTRDAARRSLARGLDDTLALGLATNRVLLGAVLRHAAFAAGDVATDFLARHFADRAASLPAPGSERLALAALCFAAHGAAALPAAWRDSALVGPREVNVPLRDLARASATRWRVERTRDAMLVNSAEAAFEFRALRFSRKRQLLSLSVESGTSGRRLRLDALLVCNELHGRCDGVELRLADLRLAATRRAARASEGDVIAPMHGRLVQLAVAPGDAVSAGQIVAVLEAMKMEHALPAPRAGTVRALRAQAGAQVSPAQLLIEIG